MTKDVSVKVKKMAADHLGIEESKVTLESKFIDKIRAKISKSSEIKN